MLSPCFDAGEKVIGLPTAELQQAAEMIQSGRQYSFEPKALAEIAALHSTAQAISPRRLLIDLARWLLPPLLILVAVFWLLARK